MKIVAVTACPTGIAHTYMAADALQKHAHKQSLSIKVETQGAMGIENEISSLDIRNADLVLIASDIPIEGAERFTNSKVLRVTIEDVLVNVEDVLMRCRQR